MLSGWTNRGISSPRSICLSDEQRELVEFCRSKNKNIKTALEQFSQFALGFETSYSRLCAEIASVVAEIEEKQVFIDLQMSMVKNIDLLKREIEAPIKEFVRKIGEKVEGIGKEEKVVEEYKEKKGALSRKIQASAGERGKKMEMWTMELEHASGNLEMHKKELELRLNELSKSKDIEISRCCMKIIEGNHKFLKCGIEDLEALDETKSMISSRLADKEFDLNQELKIGQENLQEQKALKYYLSTISDPKFEANVKESCKGIVYPAPLSYYGEAWELCVNTVLDLRGSDYFVGSLYLSNFRIVFMRYDDCLNKTLFEFPLGSIEKVRIHESFQDTISISTKDLRSALLCFKLSDSKSNFRDCILKALEKVWESPEAAFAYKFDPSISNYSPWSGYDAKAEYSRMGLPGEYFRQTLINDRYQLTPTYPSFLIVPKSISDDDVKTSAEFRARGRFIAVTWKNPKSYQFIARSSQPFSGLLGRSQHGDTKIVNQLAAITFLGVPPSLGRVREHVIRICDARPHLNALANAVVGKGYESHENYRSAQIFFANIENIHVVRSSFYEFRSLFNLNTALSPHQPENISSWVDRYLKILAELHQNKGIATWLGHISLILECVSDLASWIIAGGSVLVHCSDGWDRTAQLVSLAEILVDPYFRTIHGFCILIEKEWISFGHRFASRYGNTSKDKNQSPIMIQWLDAVFQVLRQFPIAFQFNGLMLSDIAEALYSCEYGTFLADTEQEYAKLKNRTKSLWNTLLSNEKYLNPNFDPSITEFLIPKSNLGDLTIFLHYFKRWDNAAVIFNFDEDVILDEIRKKEATYVVM